MVRARSAPAGVLSLDQCREERSTVAAGSYHVRPDIADVPIDDAASIEYALMWRDRDLYRP